MRQQLIAIVAAGLLAAGVLTPPGRLEVAANPLVRVYREGEAIRYLMKGDNQGRRYQAVASGMVKRDADGRFVEELAWSDLVVNDARVERPVATAATRQTLSLDPGYVPKIPNLAEIDRGLIGPVLDLMNFYVDLKLAMKQPTLERAGSHVLVPHGKPNSWADKTRTIVGEDAIDFDITLTSIDTGRNTAVVAVRHVPPAEARVQTPAAWMRTPVAAGTPNNWVQVVKSDGGYQASVGKETFDVRITVNLANGAIRLASMDNPVDILDRDCKDAALTDCGAPIRRQIRRVIELEAR